MGAAEEELLEELLVGRSVELELREKVVVDWVEAEVLVGRVLDVERVSDDVLERVDERLGTVDERLEMVDDERLESVEERLETVEERLGAVEERLETVEELRTVDDDKELASLEEDEAGAVVLAAESDDEDTALEVWEELWEAL